MKQRLIKVIVCACLAVSVFLCSGGVAMADDTAVSSDDLVAYIDTQESLQTFDLIPLANLEEDDYVGGALFQVLSQRGSMYFQFKSDANSRSHYLGAYTVPVYLTIGFQVERGHTYSGSVLVTGHTVVSMDDNYTTNIGSSDFHISSFVFNGYDETSPESVDVSIYPVLVSGTQADYTINVNFNNYQSTYDGYVYINLTLHFNLSTSIYNSTTPWWIQRSIGVVNSHATDWAGTLKDYATDAIVDSDGSLIKNQTIQQQQIANQQSQQSAQQHEDMKTGFQDDTYNSHVSSAGSQIDSYISQESALMDQQQNRVQDFAADNFNTGLINTYMPAIAAVSGWYTQLWNAFGQFNGAFVAILSLGVAALIIGLRRR